MKLFKLSRRASEKVQKHSGTINEPWVQSVVTFMPQENRVYKNDEEYELTVVTRNKQVTLLVHEHEYETIVFGIHVTKID